MSACATLHHAAGKAGTAVPARSAQRSCREDPTVKKTTAAVGILNVEIGSCRRSQNQNRQRPKLGDRGADIA
jgi:hypothetical protein